MRHKAIVSGERNSCALPGSRESHSCPNICWPPQCWANGTLAPMLGESSAVKSQGWQEKSKDVGLLYTTARSQPYVPMGLGVEIKMYWIDSILYKLYGYNLHVILLILIMSWCFVDHSAHSKSKIWLPYDVLYKSFLTFSAETNYLFSMMAGDITC